MRPGSFSCDGADPPPCFIVVENLGSQSIGASCIWHAWSFDLTQRREADAPVATTLRAFNLPRSCFEGFVGSHTVSRAARIQYKGEAAVSLTCIHVVLGLCGTTNNLEAGLISIPDCRFMRSMNSLTRSNASECEEHETIDEAAA